MKRLITITIILSLSVCALFAQTERDIDIAEPSLRVTVPDSLKLPILTTQGKIISPWGFYPSWGGWNTWKLHKGLNLSLGASVFSTFGSGNTWSGAGFSQSVALAYAMPLTQKLSLAIGGYFGNTSWAHTSWRDAGLTAMLGYQFDEHWSAYLYGQKSIMQSQPIPAHLLDMSDLGDRIGVAVRYDFNPCLSVQLSFDYVEMPSYRYLPTPPYNKKRNNTHSTDNPFSR